MGIGFNSDKLPEPQVHNLKSNRKYELRSFSEITLFAPADLDKNESLDFWEAFNVVNKNESSPTLDSVEEKCIEKVKNHFKMADGNIETATQGNIGDCWLIASASSIAHTPAGAKMIKDSIKQNENGTVTVTLRGAENDKNEPWSTEILNDEIHQFMEEEEAFGSSDSDSAAIELAVLKYQEYAGSKNLEWRKKADIQILEQKEENEELDVQIKLNPKNEKEIIDNFNKKWGKSLRDLGNSKPIYSAGKDGLSGNYPSYAIALLTGKKPQVSTLLSSDLNEKIDEIFTGKNENIARVISFKKGNENLLTNHAYSLIRVLPAQKEIVLRNTDGTKVNLSEEDFKKYCESVTSVDLN